MAPNTADAMSADLAPVPGVARPRRGPVALGLAGLVAALGVAAPAQGRATRAPGFAVPEAAPASVVVGGDRPWIASGPTDRAALRHGWRLAVDPTDHGVSAGWSTGRFPAHQAVLPYSPN